MTSKEQRDEDYRILDEAHAQVVKLSEHYLHGSPERAYIAAARVALGNAKVVVRGIEDVEGLP